MALLTKNNRISVKPFADIPALDGLPPIVQHAAPSVSNLSSRQGTDTGMIEGWTEGCLVTNTLKYTHRIVHWVNVAQGRDPSDVEEVLIDLDIGFPSPYWLDMDCNLNYLEAFIHTSLDLYALIAITASASTLEDLITMVKRDNDARQAEIDQTGAARPRFINLDSPSFTNPELELVALHPEHFLPRGSILTIYDPTTATHKNYVPATDRRLHEP
ncbi:hypothetical protein A0H81_13738 [Grifola frondosa]|uniref:Uncharacterized protein n=1 Tax=Grifola frondosa TaxID=5627 RepID=A0A1C7LN09_GRIFR|nr:hypothetical protein A0H81_13738 [Grifola frondosa]